MTKTKSIIIGIIIGILVFSSTAYGHDFSQQIKVFFSDIKIVVNDTEINPKDAPFVYNDRIYVPLRFIAEALDCNVTWDMENSKVLIKKKNKEVLPAQWDKGEIFVYGEALKVDGEKYVLHIKQHAEDSNTIYIQPQIKVSPMASIILSQGRQSIDGSIDDIEEGDGVGVILDIHGIARAIVIFR